MNTEKGLKVSLLLNLFTFVGLLCLTFYVAKTKQRMVYVDSGRLVNEYKRMQDARAIFQQKAVMWKANVDTLTYEVDKQIKNYERIKKSLTEKERQLSEELIRTKQSQLVEYQQAINLQAKQEDSKITDEVVREINAYLKRYGEMNNYNIMMAATEYGNIAYADETLDVTTAVLNGLNNEYSGK